MGTRQKEKETRVDTWTEWLYLSWLPRTELSGSKVHFKAYIFVYPARKNTWKGQYDGLRLYVRVSICAHFDFNIFFKHNKI